MGVVEGKGGNRVRQILNDFAAGEKPVAHTKNSLAFIQDGKRYIVCI